MDLGTPFVDLARINFTPKLLDAIPRRVALRHRVMPVFVGDEGIGAAIADVDDLDIMDAVCLAVSRPVQWHLADPLQLAMSVERHYGRLD